MSLFDRQLILQRPLRDPNLTGTDAEGVATTHTWVVPGGAQEHGVVVGPMAGVDRFLALATVLGSCLPADLRPTQSFHDLASPQPARYDGRIAGDSAAQTAGYWVGYLFERLRGTHALVAVLYAGLTAVRTCSDPFLASALTLDPQRTVETGSAAVGKPVEASCVFARLPDGRYFIRFADHEDRLHGYEGFKLICYLLRHPNKRHRLFAINRDLYAEETKSGQIECVGDESGPGLPEGYTLNEFKDSEELTKDQKDAIKAEIKRCENLAKEARANDDEEEAQEHEQRAKQGRDYLKQYTSKLSPEEEAIRKQLGKNLRTAYESLKNAGFDQLVTHLHEHLTYKLGTYKYTEDPAINWSFEPPLPRR
jgi:hypothetical protein